MHRVLLLERPASEPAPAKIRRYRLARLRLVEQREQVPTRYAHLRRPYE